MNQSVRDKYEGKLRSYKLFATLSKSILDDYYAYLKWLPDASIMVTEIINCEFQYQMFGLNFKVSYQIDCEFNTGFLVSHLMGIEANSKISLREVASVSFNSHGQPPFDDNISMFLFNATLDFISNTKNINAPLVW